MEGTDEQVSFGIDDLPVRDELRGKSPYGAPQLDVPVRLNTNENPYPLPEPLVERIAERVREAARDLNRYPDRDAVELRTRLAEYLTDTSGHEVGLANVWAANGSNEVIQQLLQTFGGPGRTAIGFEPSYSMHGLIARGTGTGWISGPRHEDFTIDLAAAEKAIAENRPDVVFVTTPNNPTGTAVPAETVLALYEAAQAAKPSMVIVDEAYIEFSHGDSLLPLLEGSLETHNPTLHAPKVTWSTHGKPFVAAVENGALWATQFHPEKSGDAGAQLLTNWIGTL
ncbi:Histidinol-phosphate aminotransferase [Streptomyces aurantiogriseus]